MRSMTKCLLVVLLLAVPFAAACSSAPYTAKVVDAETGEPVEGAVYLAVWWETVSGKKAWFEGASVEMAKFVEGHTDEKGWIQVPRFWFRYPFARERTLTAYKPGYVMWNQEYVFPTREKRSGFDASNREVRLERWKDSHKYGDQSALLSAATRGSIRGDLYKGGAQLLYKEYRKHEADLYRKERMDKQ
jgi:hypothetical protein